MLTREQIMAGLAALEKCDDIRAAATAGSDATGRTDDLSDIDLMLYIRPGSVEACGAAVEGAFAGVGPIAIAHRLPMPTWHGHHQTFYQLRGAPEHLMLDVVFIEVGPGQPAHPWFQVERHGRQHALFDRDGIIREEHVDRAAMLPLIRKRVADVRTRFALFRHLPPKLAGRELPADAAYFYQAIVLRSLVDMLRAVHCPDRYDFGFRYLRDDLPGADYEAVCRLCYPRSAADIRGFTNEISTRIAALLAEWDAANAG